MQEAKQAAYGASPEDPRLEQSSADIEKVEKSITALEKQIAQVDAEITELKKSSATEARHDDIAWLRRKKEQLRREQEQLREERLLVMRQAYA